MWLEGSYATGAFNEQSDIDVWLDVDDGAFEQCTKLFRNALLSFTEIDWEESRGIYSVSPKLAKHIFHPKNLPKTQTIELDLQEHSRHFVFDKKEHTIKILFDHDGTIQWKE